MKLFYFLTHGGEGRGRGDWGGVLLLSRVFLDTSTHPILGPLVPLFGISDDATSGFKARVGSAYSLVN